MHDEGPGHADVTEGSGGIWERLRYGKRALGKDLEQTVQAIEARNGVGV